MKQLLTKIFGFLLLYSVLVSQGHAQSTADHILGDDRTTVVPDHFLREFDPVTVFFKKKTGPDKAGVVQKPGRLFNIVPDHPGEYRWIDGKTLQFFPTIAWPALEKYVVTVQNSEHRLITLMKPPVSVTPDHGSSHLEPISDITLKFSDLIDVKRLSRMISFEVRNLPGLGEQEAVHLTGRDFQIKSIERSSLGDETVYKVSLKKPIGYGKKVILNIKLALDPSIESSVVRYEFSTKPLFRLTGMGCASVVFPIASTGSVYTKDQIIHCGKGSQPVFLQFSDRLGSVTLEQIKRFVKFKPAVKNLRFEQNGRRIYLYFDSGRDLPYHLSLNHTPIQSQSFRNLAPFNETSMFFYHSQASPYLKWAEKQGIVERYGPQKFPMAGRETPQVDLRIYKVDPLDHNFWPFAGNGLVVRETKRPDGPGEEPAVGSDMAEQIRQLGSPLVSRLVTLPIENRGGDLKFGLDLSREFEKISGRNQPGTYLVGYRSIGAYTERHYVRIQVTDLSLSTVEEEAGIMFVVTSLKTGRPVKDAEIIVEGSGGYSGKFDWKPVISGITDDKGMLRYDHLDEVDERIRRIIVRKGRDTLVINPAKPPSQFVNNHWYPSHDNWLQWLNRNPRHHKEDEVDKVFIFSERPVYKPDEDVHIKGYLRTRKQGKLFLAHADKLTVRVLGPGGKSWNYPVELTAAGSFYYNFKEDDLPTGNYNACLINSSRELGCVDFKMENYRIPKFEIQISGPDKVPLDRPFELTMTADYYAGGQVVDQAVTWRATQFPYSFTPPSYSGFIFSTNKRFYGGNEDFDSTGGLQKSGKTDTNGSSTFVIDPTSELNAQPRQYVVEATVRGADEQTVTNTKKVVALPPYMVGLKLKRLLKSSMTIKPEILVLNHHGKLAAGVELTLRLYQRQWHSHLKETDITTGKAKFLSEVVDNLILEKRLVAKGRARPVPLRVDESGIYIVEVTARDKLGRLQKVSSDLYVAGEAPVTWQKTKANVFSNSLDKRDYIPGDTANLVIKSPFQNGRALVVVEKPDRNSYHWVPITNGQGLLKIKIEENMVPQLPVHTLLMRGRLKKRDSQTLNKSDRAKPTSMAATSWIKVKPKNNRLKLALRHPDVKLPGSTMDLAIEMTDPDGKPIDGEVTLWLVDKAVLALGKEKRLDPVPAFIDPTRSYIRIRDTRNDVIGDLFVGEQTGGDGQDGTSSIFDKVTVRKNFKTVPYYNPNIRVRKGKAVVTIQIPDNLTDFAIRAVATNGKARFGHTKSKVSIRLPLIIQSALPRFVRPGDQFVAGGIGRVVTGKGGEGRVELQVEGLSVEARTDRSLIWNSRRPQQLFFPMTVKSDYDATKPDNDVTIRMAVERDYDEAKDAFQIKLPIKADRSIVHESKFTEIRPGQPVELMQPSETPRPGTFRNSIVITSEPALIKMIAGLDYLIRFPHGCTEQRISRLLPEMLLTDLKKFIGNEAQEKRFKHSLDETLQYLKSVKKPNGLYSYWPGSNGYVSLTAYVVEFLLTAKRQGHHFDQSLLRDGINALKKGLRSDYANFIGGRSYYERAAALYALALADELDEGYVVDLYSMAFNQDLYSEANILYAMKKYMERDKEIEKLKKDLWSNIIFRMRNGKEEYQGLQYRFSNWGGLINSSEVRTLASVSKALYLSDHANPRIRYLVDELISLGQGDGWGNTAANASALIALGEVVSQPNLPKKGHELKLTVLQEKAVLFNTRESILQKKTYHKLTKGSLEYISGPDNAYPHVMFNLRYLPSAGGDKVVQKNNGFVVDREAFIVRKNGKTPVKLEIKPGEPLTLEMGTIIEEHLQVINPEKRHFVAIRAPFAAGLDPLNPNLATSPKEAKPAGSLTLSPSYSLYEDDQVTFYYDTLPKGTYHFYFRLRSTTQGSFSHPAAVVEMMYKQSVRGRSNGTRVIVNARK